MPSAVRGLMRALSPETCGAIRALHESGFTAIVMGRQLIVRAFPRRPVPAELVELVRAHAHEIAQFLVETSQ